MKTIFFILILFFILQPDVNCQIVWVKQNEFTQVLDKFILLQNNTSSEVEYDCVVKLNIESEPHTYSIAITAIGYKEDIPIDSLYYIKHKHVNFYIIKSPDIIISEAAYIKLSLAIQSPKQPADISEPITFEDVAIYSPIIRVFKIGKKNVLFPHRIVYFESYNPINTISKKYWPVEKPMNAWTDHDIFLFDKKSRVAQNSDKVEKVKGKFRIKTN